MYPSPPLCGSNKLRMSSVEYTLCELRGRGLYPRGPSLPAVLSAVAGRPAWSRRANTCMAVSGNERSRLSRQLYLFFLAYQGQTLAKSDWLLSNTPSSVFYFKSFHSSMAQDLQNCVHLKTDPRKWTCSTLVYHLTVYKHQGRWSETCACIRMHWMCTRTGTSSSRIVPSKIRKPC
jgi:hypothetical protein